MFAVFVGPADGDVAVESVHLEVTAARPAELLVAWLEELLYLSEVRGLALQEFTSDRVAPNHATGSADGCRFLPEAVIIGPVVKGVSRHGLELRPSRAGWLARVIFDV